MTVLSFRDGRPVTDPWSLRCLIVELCVELELARRESCRARGLPDPPRLHLVPDDPESAG
jgi:hypothetical protein